MTEHVLSQTVVVGVDGSPTAVHAALWASAEAHSRDIPLTLLAVIDDADDHGVLRRRAEDALRGAAAVVEMTGQAVKIEAEIARGPITQVLRRSSRDAALLCVGAIGVDQTSGRRVGSTATQLSESALCPVAVVRSGPLDGRAIIAELDESRASAQVLATAVDEAVLRGSPLILLSCGAPVRAGIAPAESIKQLAARHEKMATGYRKRHPGLALSSVVTGKNLVGYLMANGSGIGLVVVGRNRHGGVAELLRRPAVARCTEPVTSVLVCPSDAL